VKQFGQHSFGRDQRQPELLECIHTKAVPAIRSVQPRQNGARVDQCVSGP
jgi:hypothetical protein